MKKIERAFQSKRVKQSEGVERNRCSLIGGMSAGMVQLLMDHRRFRRIRVCIYMLYSFPHQRNYMLVLVCRRVAGKQVAPKPHNSGL